MRALYGTKSDIRVIDKAAHADKEPLGGLLGGAEPRACTILALRTRQLLAGRVIRVRILYRGQKTGTA